MEEQIEPNKSVEMLPFQDDFKICVDHVEPQDIPSQDQRFRFHPFFLSSHLYPYSHLQHGSEYRGWSEKGRGRYGHSGSRDRRESHAKF